MRLLHTSDWHLGQSLHQYDRSHEHEHFLAWLLETLVKEGVDALLVAGDLFDTSNPSAAAQACLYRFVIEARRRVPHLNIVLTAGNHDSAARLEAPSPILSVFDTHVVGQVSGHMDDDGLTRLVVPLRDRHGDIRAWCIAMPFLRPGDVPRVDDADDPYLAGIARLYRQAFAHADARREPGQAIVALGHCHLSGGQTSEESERRILIGGTEALPADIFDDAIAYVALGHLHLPQQVGGKPSRRYSGSPLPMSFAEIDYPHQVVIVDLAGEGIADIRARPIPRRVELLRIPAQPAPLEQVLAELTGLALPERPESEWPYLQVRVLLQTPEPGLRTQIESALQGKPVRLARIETRYAQAERPEAVQAVSIDEFKALEPGDFFQRLHQQRFGAAAPAALLQAFDELVHGLEGEQP